MPGLEGGVCILSGVTIGEGAVVGANSVVTKDIAPYSIAVGTPAKIMRDNEKDCLPRSRNSYYLQLLFTNKYWLWEN